MDITTLQMDHGILPAKAILGQAPANFERKSWPFPPYKQACDVQANLGETIAGHGPLTSELIVQLYGLKQ